MTQRERIEQLTRELELEREKTRISAIIDKAKLPPCKSMACWGCKHVVTYTMPRTRRVIVLGCGKYRSCEDYEPAERDRSAVREAIEKELLQQEL